MKIFLDVSRLIVPFIIFGIVTYGIIMRVSVYDSFVKGARNGFFTVIKIMPTLIGLMVAVGILRASGFLDFLSGFLGNFFITIIIILVYWFFKPIRIIFFYHM